jgi:hypothetical protein
VSERQYQGSELVLPPLIAIGASFKKATGAQKGSTFARVSPQRSYGRQMHPDPNWFLCRWLQHGWHEDSGYTGIGTASANRKLKTGCSRPDSGVQLRQSRCLKGDPVMGAAKI